MSQLKVKANLPLGLAWNWVKFSFATFREKPINFFAFGIAFILFSTVPFIGSFLSIFVLARIYISADKVANNENIGLALNFGEIFKRRNIVSFALFNMFFDLLLMSIFQESLLALHIESGSPEMLADHRVMLILVALSLFRTVFIGISAAIITFNPEIKVLGASLLNWKFLLKNLIVVILAIFLLLPFLVIPLYISAIIAFSVSNMALSIFAGIWLVIFILLFIIVSAIFCYKLYVDGVING